jgi:IS5 family transposase
MHDSQAFEPLIQCIPKVRSRRGPRRRKPAKVHADKAYDTPDCHRVLRERRIGDRIARRGIESSARLGRQTGKGGWHPLHAARLLHDPDCDIRTGFKFAVVA